MDSEQTSQGPVTASRTSPEPGSGPTRRDFMKTAGTVAGVSALTGVAVPAVHAQGSEEVHVALVGCGGRGSGAIGQALSTKGPIKAVAMADAFADRLKASHDGLSKAMKPEQFDVPEERRFIGWDAYKHAMDTLRPGDVVILTTPPAFRWVHFQYAIQKGLHVFMEKPVTVDGPTSRRMLELGAQASAKNLKVGVGLMSRHSKPMQELHARIRNGELGDILLMRGYRVHPPAGTFESVAKPDDMSHLDYQIRRFHSFLWASGGNFSDFYIHHIDHLCWMKGSWPVKAIGFGGRHFKESPEGKPFVDQNMDSYSVEYTFADGTKFNFIGRHMRGAYGIYASYVHGTKGMGVVSRANDVGTPSAIYKGQDVDASKLVWQSRDTSNPYQNEWDVLMDAIRNGKPHNEVKRGVEASLVTSLGRMAVHCAQEVTYQEILNSTHEFAPGLDKLTKDSPAPLMPDASGFYPKPKPGMIGKKEY